MIKHLPNFWIKTSDVQLIDSAFDLCLKLGYNVCEKDYKDIKGIGLFTTINDCIDFNNISYNKPKLFLIYNGEDLINGNLKKYNNLLDLINNYQSDLDQYCQYLKKTLQNLLEKYPNFTIGQEIVSESDLKNTELNTSRFIKGYSYVNGWMLRTNTGWSFFEDTIIKKDYLLMHNLMLKKKQKRIRKK